MIESLLVLDTKSFNSCLEPRLLDNLTSYVLKVKSPDLNLQSLKLNSRRTEEMIVVKSKFIQ